MDALIILALIAGVPVLLALFLRVSAVFLFLSIAAGNLLVLYLGDDAGLALAMFVKGPNSNLIAQFTLLFLPIVLSLFFLRKTLPKSKYLLHAPAVLADGLALAVLALPLFDGNAQAKIFANQYGNSLRESQDIVIGTAAGLVLLIMWATYKHKEDKKHHKKHH